jgi:SAM-dependent methyltransferase
MERFGSAVEPKEFYWAVNRAYHAAESANYETLHKDMFEGLGGVWGRLLRHLPPEPARLRVLDVGAGTGLVEQFLVKHCPDRIERVVVLDPSKEMLDQSRKKATQWPFASEFQLGDISSIPGGATFHVVTMNSVLHHIVELDAFCNALRTLIVSGGCFLHAHDPRDGAADDEILSSRKRQVAEKTVRRPSMYRRLRAGVGGVVRSVTGMRRLPPLALETCRPLLEQGIIARPMDMESIWAVTDFHVPGQPGSIGHGISLAALQEWLGPSFRRQDTFTYQFFGLPWDHLDADDRATEEALMAKSDPHGAVFAAAWVKA